MTGGSRGIGRAIVEPLARDGATVVFSFVQAEQAAADVCTAVAVAGGRAGPSRWAARRSSCLEGIAGGAAIAARWGRPAEQLDGDELRAAVALEAAYLAAGLRNIVYPRRKRP
ncbi:MAG: hypothetical protein ACRDRO_17030 [Pseudonocardiaceae bacterium]